MSRRRILVIDDEEKFGQLIKMNLEATTDYEVFLATGGTEGLELAKHLDPDLILLDIMMPDMSGLEVLKRLKKDKSTMAISVIMLTAKDDSESRISASQLCGEAYMVKPISVKDLKARIDEVLVRR